MRKIPFAGKRTGRTSCLREVHPVLCAPDGMKSEKGIKGPEKQHPNKVKKGQYYVEIFWICVILNVGQSASGEGGQ